jgi:streptogramin lyase
MYGVSSTNLWPRFASVKRAVLAIGLFSGLVQEGDEGQHWVLDKSESIRKIQGNYLFTVTGGCVVVQWMTAPLHATSN